MGADLYIPRLRKPHEQQWQKDFNAAVVKRDVLQESQRKQLVLDEFRGVGAGQVNADITNAREAQKEVDAAYERMYAVGYFRDSYNNSSVLWRLGLSWWKDLKPDCELNPATADAEINCSPELCRAFLSRVEAAELKLIPKEGEKDFKVDAEGENSAESWNAYFTAKREKLVAFLREAADNGGMYASC